MKPFNFNNFTEEEFYNQIEKDPSVFIGKEIVCNSFLLVNPPGINPSNLHGILIEISSFQNSFYKIYILFPDGTKAYTCLIGDPFTEGQFTKIRFV